MSPRTQIARRVLVGMFAIGLLVGASELVFAKGKKGGGGGGGGGGKTSMVQLSASARGLFKFQDTWIDGKAFAMIMGRWQVPMKSKSERLSDPMNFTWMVYVPKSYDGKQPFGILAFVNSANDGTVPSGWRGVLEKRQLIGISAYQAGNKEPASFRHAYTSAGVKRLREVFKVDADRIYISGFSGGGRVASRMTLMEPDLYTGGIYCCGCDYIRGGVGDGYEVFRVAPDLARRARDYSRIVLLTGSKDMNNTDTQSVARMCAQDGFRYTKLIVVPGMGHSVPPGEHFDKAIEFMDGPLAGQANAQLEVGKRQERSGQLGAARDAYARCAAHGTGDVVAQAKSHEKALKVKYDQAVAAIEKAIATGKSVATPLNELRSTWGTYAAEDAKRLADKAAAARAGKPR